MQDYVSLKLLSSFYAELSDLIGTEAMLKFHDFYKGNQISAPIHLYDRDKLGRQVRVEYHNGQSKSNLARKYGYSERWISRMVSLKEKKFDD
ncbi:Mor transcription activator family protein [Liquorilactobacillus hordei]|uniref:Mor transcription activator family protein n=1 Tax=Liquorilactobacillus hordei TaxID=468911 RepID=UPI001CBE0E22|nr:Mor transcription activator family protein [Liquorilactobacillus hordei]MBZ2405778.1 hypothetical protein [Liquorilactobacillus hordei]